MISPQEAITRIRESANKAIALDPSIAEPHAALGAVAAMCDRDWKSAEQHFQRALALNPQYQTAHMWYANYCLVPIGPPRGGARSRSSARAGSTSSRR